MHVAVFLAYAPPYVSTVWCLPRSLQNLTLLRVSENRISGSFPDVLLKFKRLEVLYMSHNMMSCTLPDFPPEFLKQVRSVACPTSRLTSWHVTAAPSLMSACTS